MTVLGKKESREKEQENRTCFHAFPEEHFLLNPKP